MIFHVVSGDHLMQKRLGGIRMHQCVQVWTIVVMEIAMTYNFQYMTSAFIREYVNFYFMFCEVVHISYLHDHEL